MVVREHMIILCLSFCPSVSIITKYYLAIMCRIRAVSGTSHMTFSEWVRFYTVFTFGFDRRRQWIFAAGSQGVAGKMLG